MGVRKVGKSEKRKGEERAVRALRRDGVQCPKSCSLDTESIHKSDVPEQAGAKPAGKHYSSILEGKRWQTPALSLPHSQGHRFLLSFFLF